MLNFFRKHQKIFFIFVTVIIVLSFSFFGTFSTFAGSQDTPDVEVAKLLNGAPLHQSDMIGMHHFIKHEVELFSDSMIEKEFFSSGLAAMLAEKYFDLIRPDIENRMMRLKHFQFYEHPQAPFISVMNVYEQFAPQIKQIYLQLIQSTEVTPKEFALLCELYHAQKSIPPQFMHQILSYQQGQHTWIKPDPQLAHADLSIGGFHHLEDYLGPRFIEILSQFVFNAAAYAEAKGYHISKDEARAEYLFKIQQALSQTEKKQAGLAESYYYQLMQNTGMNEDLFLKQWQKILYCSHFLEEPAKATLLSSEEVKELYQLMKEKAKVVVYQLPKELRITDFASLMKWQVYLEAISGIDRKELYLPTQFLSAAEIEKKYPELLFRSCVVKMASINKKDLGLDIGLKEMWQWQLEEKNFEWLKSQFPTLGSQNPLSDKERDAAFESIDPQMRVKIDNLTRLKMIDEHPEKIKAALENKELEQVTLHIPLKGEVPQLKGLEDISKLIEVLEAKDTPLVGEVFQVTYDGEHHYSMQIIEPIKEAQVMTFAQASQAGTLDLLLDQQLEAAYPQIRKNHAKLFQLEDDSWKPFEQVKDQIGEIYYQDLLQAIEKECKEVCKTDKWTLDLYAAYRFYPYMNNIHSHLVADTDHTDSLQSGSLEPTLADQWKLEKKELEFTRKEQLDVINEIAFTLKEREWSGLLSLKSGDFCFLTLLEKMAASEPSLEELKQMHHPLANEAKRSVMQELLALLQEKQVIQLKPAY